MIIRLAENHAVEGRINNIAHGTCQNQGKTDQNAVADATFDQAGNVKYQKSNRRNAEKAQRQFAVFATKFPTERHARVFDKIESRPRQTE